MLLSPVRLGAEHIVNPGARILVLGECAEGIETREAQAVVDQ